MRPSFHRYYGHNRPPSPIFIFGTLIIVSFLSHLALFRGRNCTNLRPSLSSIHRSTNPLPKTHRLAPSHQCLHSRSRKYAKASKKPQIPVFMQRDFASGGYNKIARGSGDVNAVGPIINVLSKLQHNMGIYGSLAEMGVHHGRFTGFLFITARSTEKLVVADLFEQQNPDQAYKNVDKSGLGDKRKFLSGLQTYGLSERDLHALIEGSSDEIDFDWSIQLGFEPFRMISVDASHTAAFTFNDLQLAHCNLLRGGVIILDDWFHSVWPGVVEGFYQFAWFYEDAYPFLVCESKLFFTNDRALHQQYYEALLHDPELQDLLSPYAHEKERGKLLFEMNGVHYLKCASRSNMTVARIQEVWMERVY